MSTAFQNELDRSPIDIPRAALIFAREIAYPGLDIDRYLERLDLLAEAASKLLSPAASSGEQAESLAAFLFRRAGFQGNASDYADPRNSYLNEVLDRRVGIPISLSAIYVAIARRLGLPAYGAGLPGHFIVGVDDPQGAIYLDPFHGGRRLSIEECANLVTLTTGYSGAFQIEWLNPAAPRDILARMLHNLRNVYLQQEAWLSAIQVVDHLRMIQPGAPEYLRDLGVFHHQGGSLRLAVQYYEQYLLNAPQARDAEGVRQSLQSAAQDLSRMN